MRHQIPQIGVSPVLRGTNGKLEKTQFWTNIYLPPWNNQSSIEVPPHKDEMAVFNGTRLCFYRAINVARNSNPRFVASTASKFRSPSHLLHTNPPFALSSSFTTTAVQNEKFQTIFNRQLDQVSDVFHRETLQMGLSSNEVERIINRAFYASIITFLFAVGCACLFVASVWKWYFGRKEGREGMVLGNVWKDEETKAMKGRFWRWRSCWSKKEDVHKEE